MSIINCQLSIILCLASTGAAAQSSDPIPAETKLAPRSAIVPYASRESALEGDPACSPWFIAIDDWQKEAAADYIRYSTRVKIPRTWGGRAVILRVRGATSSIEVEVNGVAAGYSLSGMVRTEFDLTGFIGQDYNNISITVHGNSPVREVENHRLGGELTIGGAALISQPMVRIRDLVVDTSVDGISGRFSLAVVMQSHLRNSKEYTVSYELIDTDGNIVTQSSREFTTKWMNGDTLRFSAAVPGVKRWNHETPHLYTLVARTFHEGRLAEYVAARVGFRRVSHGNGSLLIDGVEIPIYNTVFGWQGGRSETLAGLRVLKGQGFNCVTVPGYPQPDAFYSACDEVGMYVRDVADVDTSGGPKKITRGGNRSNDPTWQDVFVSRAMEMFHCSQLHPSVVMLSPAGASTPNGYCLYESYLALKKTGAGRPVIYAGAEGQWNNDNVHILSPADRKPDVSVDCTHLSGSGVVYVENNMALTPLKGVATYRIMQGGKVRHTDSVEIDIPCGDRFQMTISAEASSKARKQRSLEVSISVNRADYCLPAPEDNDERNGPMTVIARESVEY